MKMMLQFHQHLQGVLLCGPGRHKEKNSLTKGELFQIRSLEKDGVPKERLTSEEVVL
jgi:hypothetical protein